MAMPLEGIRVIDWTIWQQGPVASTMLGDLGAEVIKIETPVGGDPGRGIARLSGVDVGDRPNFYFEANNRNKKGITLDLSKPEAREIVYRLVEEADVFVQNFRKGVAARLQLDYATLREHNPLLIYASASGYGPEGPDSGEPSFDLLGLARSGMMLAAGEPGMPPLSIGGAIADQMGGIMLAYGVLAAIVARERLGVGQQVDASHLGSMAMLQGLSLSMKLMVGTPAPRTTRTDSFNPLFNYYRCADDRWIALAMLQAERYWADFCRALGRPDLLDDERFADAAKATAHRVEAIEIFDAVFATRPRADWMKQLGDSPGDFIFTLVNSIDDLATDPQMLANDYIAEFDHPRFGPTQMVGLPVGLSETPGRIRRPAPELGQHTEEVLVDLLGYDWDRIAELRKREAI
jgi:crotonobetainyl-CoA:carnitine CoA-transferase CaiB-like acyl-CoA transferase